MSFFFNLKIDLNLKSSTSQAQKAVKYTGKEINVDARNPVDLNYAYMLVYVNCNSMQANFKHSHSNSVNINENKLMISSSTNSSYDHTRTLFIFKCIEQILDKCNKEFLISIICTSLNPNYKSQIATSTTAGSSNDFSYNNGINSNNTPYSVHNEKLLELIYRHLKSIYGSSFYSNPSSSQNIIDSLRPTTYIEAIIMVLLFYIRSYYPPASFNLTGAFKRDRSLEQPHFIPHQVKAQTLDSASRQKLNIQSTIIKSASASSLHSAANVSSSTSSASSKSSNSSTLSHSPDTSSVKFHLNDDDEYVQTHNDYHIHSLNEENVLEERAFKSSSVDQDEQLFIENRNVQINTLQILSKIIKELTSLCQSSNFVSNRTSNLSLANCSQAIIDLLDRSKLQKTLLHCFYSTILNPIQNSLTFCILNTNSSSSKGQNFNFKKQIQYTYVVELMNTLENLIELEHLLNDYLTINSIQKGPRNNGIGYFWEIF